jgi:MFS family permease
VPRLRESLTVLRQRDFRLLFAGQAVSVFGDRMVSIALAFAVLELGGSATQVGLVLACRTLPQVACLPVGGVVADRVSRRTVVVGADVARLATQGLLAALLIAGAPPLWAVAVLAGLTGAATGFFNPALTGLLPAVVAAEELQQANGLRATAMSGGEILGPAVAGLVVASAGPGWALAIDAATFSVSAALLARLRLPPSAARAPSSFMVDLRDGWDEFRSRTWVWSLVAAAALANLVWGAWNVLGPVVADRDLGGAATWGTLLAALGAGALAGALLTIRSSPRRPLLVVVFSMLLFCAPLALLAGGAPPPLLAVGTFMAGVGMMFGNSVWESTLQRHIPAESLSRVSAYDWFGALAFQPLGLAIWGPIAALVGITAALWAAAVTLAATALALLAVRDVRHLPPMPAPRPVASPAIGELST